MSDAIRAMHDAAVREGRNGYIDPISGYRVFTELAHLRRGSCCGSGCRHCPYGFLEVPHPTERGDAPWWQLSGPVGADALDVVSWSGGKDAFLALRRQPPVGRVVLLTTYDPVAGRVPVQEVSLPMIRAQARSLGVDLLAVPLPPGADYLDRLRSALAVAGRRAPVRRLSFGDLHLDEVRRWREGALADVPLSFPLWHVSYEALLDELEQSGVTVRVSASRTPAVPVGARFDRALVASLPPGVDAFGERGEFHTCVEIPSRAMSGAQPPSRS